MKRELDKALCEKFPKIFADRYGDMRETCMCWGFNCGDGWYGLIHALCETLQNHADNGGTQVVAVQVKEKYGSLRFYTIGLDDFTDGAIQMAENMSYNICENCGAPGILETSGWYKVRCENCE